jgi:hypothetical protein
MSKKSTIYFPDSLLKILNSFGVDNSSGAICTLIERYDRITREAIPELTENEWMCFCDIHNGCGGFLSAGGMDQAPSAWASVADSVSDGLSEKWGVGCKDFSAKLQALPLVGRIAVWDVAARFWASPNLNKISARELLIEAGAKINKDITG